MTPKMCFRPRLVRGVMVPGCGGTCEACQSYVRARWIARVGHETDGRKSWVVTLTYAGSVEPGYDEVQKAVKRMRKAGLEPRYFAVIERGSLRGRWHCHMIVTCDCTRRKLEKHWHAGFSKAKLLGRGGAAAYVTKYLRKGNGRAKASLRYGWSRVLGSTVAAVFRYFPDASVIACNGRKLFKPERVKANGKLTSIRPVATSPSVWTDEEIEHERNVLRRLDGAKLHRKRSAIQFRLPIGGAPMSWRPDAEGGPYVAD